jgi:ParB-like chromosome segregation protein Spo0J
MNDLRIVKVQISSLQFDPDNARKHSDKNIDSIMNSLKRFGQRKPIVVTGSNVVIAGNGTLAAAKKLGWSQIVVAYTPSDWTFEQARAYALVDNRTAELAEWDNDKLAMQLIELDSVGWELNDVGFEKLEPPTEEMKDKKSNWVDCDDCGRKVLNKDNEQSTETY